MELGGWVESADAWIEGQGDHGDFSRREILDPFLDKILGSAEGLQTLDVGCGEGRYARKLASKGAIVTGIDPVEKFIDHARRLHPDGTYLISTAELLPLEDQSFDLVLSYLSIIDTPDFRGAIREMVRVLKPSGRIIVVTISNMASTSDGWVKDPTGRRLYRTVDRYMEEFELDLKWGGLHIINFHRPLSAILEAFFEAGIKMDGFYEPLPSPESPAYKDEFRVPNFQIMSFRF